MYRAATIDNEESGDESKPVKMKDNYLLSLLFKGHSNDKKYFKKFL